MNILQDAWDKTTNTLAMTYNQELGKTIGLDSLIKRISSKELHYHPPNILIYTPSDSITVFCNSKTNCINELRELWLSQACFYECDFDTNLLIFGVLPISKDKLLYSYGQRTEVIKTTDKPSTMSLMKAIQASEELLGLYSVEASDFNFSKFMANKNGTPTDDTYQN